MDQYLAQVLLAGFNFAPKGWALCQAQTLSIQQNAALFSILGTYYGGNGVSTFGLPDLRGRSVVSQGQGPGLSPYDIGQLSGAPTVTLLPGNLPLHTHPLNATAAASNAPSPATCLVGSNATHTIFGSPASTTMAPGMVVNAGNNLPVPIVQPYLVLNYIIALTGVFPSRN